MYSGKESLDKKSYEWVDAEKVPPEVEVVNLFVEYVPFVEEENHRLDRIWSGLEPGVLEDRPEKSNGLLQPVHRRVFDQSQVVLGQRGDEDD